LKVSLKKKKINNGKREKRRYAGYAAMWSLLLILHTAKYAHLHAKFAVTGVLDDKKSAFFSHIPLV